MRDRTDAIASVLMILLGIGVVIESTRLKIGTPLKPQPGLFPLLGGLLLIGLSFVLLARSALRSGKLPPKIRETSGELRRPVILIAGLSAYTAVLEYLGYVLPTIILAAVILRVLGVKSWKILTVASLSLSVGTYLLFGRILGIELPSASLPLLG